MTEQLRVALIGCGGMGTGHARAIEREGLAKVVAAVDPKEEARSRLASICAAKGYESVQAMLAAEKIDAALVATTNPHHAEVTIPCLEAGVSVLCEKPMATTFADCKRMTAAQGDPLPFLQIGFELRTCAPFQKINDIIASGEIGEVRHVHFLQTPGAKKKGSWHVRRDVAGGLFLEKLCHQIDTFRMLLGSDPDQVVAISAANVMPHYEVPDNMYATFTFPDGRAAHISFIVGRAAEVARHTPEEYMDKEHWLEYIIIGTKGSISMPLWKMELVVTHNRDGHIQFGRRIRLEGRNAEAPYHDTGPEHEMFFRAVREGRRSEFTADDSLETMRAVFAAEKSAAESGRPVKIAEIDA